MILNDLLNYKVLEDLSVEYQSAGYNVLLSHSGNCAFFVGDSWSPTTPIGRKIEGGDDVCPTLGVRGKGRNSEFFPLTEVEGFVKLTCQAA
jgi:hypothetical protein